MEKEVDVFKLTKDVKSKGNELSKEEAKYLVEHYYQVQEYRKSANNQCRAISKTGTTNEALAFFADNFEKMEKNIKAVLEVYVQSQEIGRWLTSIAGIGPVIAAGLITQIDIEKVRSAGQIQAFAGYDPTRTWEKGCKRPYNAKLKTLCWKIGESFVKVSNRPQDVYGKVYRTRKEYENEKNENLEYKEQADAKLKTNIGKNTEAYKWYSVGKLPPGHINARAKRYAVKLFLSHFFSVWYEIVHKEKPPKPYPIAILNHAHEIPIPNWPLENKS